MRYPVKYKKITNNKSIYIDLLKRNELHKNFIGVPFYCVHYSKLRKTLNSSIRIKSNINNKINLKEIFITIILKYRV